MRGPHKLAFLFQLSLVMPRLGLSESWSRACDEMKNLAVGFFKTLKLAACVPASRFKLVFDIAVYQSGNSTP